VPPRHYGRSGKVEPSRWSEPPPRWRARGRAGVATRCWPSTVPVGGGRSPWSLCEHTLPRPRSCCRQGSVQNGVLPSQRPGLWHVLEEVTTGIQGGTRIKLLFPILPIPVPSRILVVSLIAGQVFREWQGRHFGIAFADAGWQDRPVESHNQAVHRTATPRLGFRGVGFPRRRIRCRCALAGGCR